MASDIQIISIFTECKKKGSLQQLSFSKIILADIQRIISFLFSLFTFCIYFILLFENICLGLQCTIINTQNTTL